MRLRSRLPDAGVTIFSVMSQLAAEHQAINLSQGFPDFNPDPQLVELVGRHMRDGANQYAPMQGAAPLRQAVAEKIRCLYGADLDPQTQITVTTGATEALYCAIAAVVHPGDEVLLLDPCYDAYVSAVLLNQGRPVRIALNYPGYTVDWERVRAALSPRTRLLVLNSPHNPTGTILRAEDIQALRDLTANSDLLILSDEVYEHILFDGRRHESMLCYPDLARRSFVVSSFGKTYHATGWKLGYCAAPEDLTRELRKVHQFVTFSVNTPMQHAVADFMRREQSYMGLSGFYQKKRDLFMNLIGPSRFKALPCAGTYFMMLEYSAITDEADVAFARRLTTEFGVAAIPPSVFYEDARDHKVLRFCFAKQDQTLQQAAERLCRI